MTIPVPSQPMLHKQWCLFDQGVNIDFDREVRKIAGTAEDNLEKTVNEREGRKIVEMAENNNVKTVNDRGVTNIDEAAEDNLEKTVNEREGRKIVGTTEDNLEKIVTASYMDLRKISRIV